MPQNLELKASIDSPARTAAAARRLGARDRGILRQVDTYYNAPAGRLKLRVIDGTGSELIAYARPDKTNGRYSEYLVLPVSDPILTDRLFRVLLGVRIVVRKKRRLFLFQNARIHIDEVRGLGSFIEFEVLVTKGKKQARALFERLVREFGIDERKTIGGSYSDMLAKE